MSIGHHHLSSSSHRDVSLHRTSDSWMIERVVIWHDSTDRSLHKRSISQQSLLVN